VRALLLVGSLAALVIFGGCSAGRPRVFKDGGAFQLPDSGLIYDGGTPMFDAEAPDSGPFICNPACDADAGSVCACLASANPRCGCHDRQGLLDDCDPQAPRSCRWPLLCALAATNDGTRYLCTDGSSGTPCYPTDQEVCNTDRGCLCTRDPLFPATLACSCQGPNGPSRLLCDPNDPSTCPALEGVCVEVPLSNGQHFYICSDGSELEPCRLGQPSCKTSLGCTCPTAGGLPYCRCSEPATRAGQACDPAVDASCVAPLTCAVRTVDGGLASVCGP
jgi:hypothetical protein